MSSLLEIEAAANALPVEQKQLLLRFLTASLRESGVFSVGASLTKDGGDVLLTAPAGAPPMTPETVREILEDWP
jgi:hypothetical protein